MFQKVFLLPTLLGATVVAMVAASSCNKFYRKDYTYLDQFDAYYKLHWDRSGQSWRSAFLACDDEGAALFYPKTKDEWSVVKALVEPMKTKPNVTEVFIGIHDEFGLGEFMTVDGLSTPSPLPDKDGLEGQSACVTMDIDTGVYKLQSCDTDDVKPFVCKKVEEKTPYCPTIDRGYTYDKETKKCYKISQRKKTWTDAMQTCFMEGAILAIVTNRDEADVITNILSGQNLENVDHFVGFRRLFPNGDFYTVKGVHYETLGHWDISLEPYSYIFYTTPIKEIHGQPDSQKYDNSFYKNWRTETNIYGQSTGEDDTTYDCGVIQKNSDNRVVTGTKSCLEQASFICEMEPKY